MKRNVLFLLTLISLSCFVSNAQRGVRIGYIDTEYILENVPEYTEANIQLDQKVQQWKTDIEQRLNTIESKKKQLNSERVLLTQQLYEERLEDIGFEEAEILDYQQKRFGPNGDLMIQKQQLIQPIQDQIFAAVQEIAENKKYDFIFDKSADVVMLYSAERYDISEMIIRSITRSAKRTQATSRSERKEAEREEVVPEINEAMDEREKVLEERQTARETAMDERNAERLKRRDSLKDAAAARRQNILDERAAAKAARDSVSGESASPDVERNTVAKDSTKATGAIEATTSKTPEQLAEEKRQEKLTDREERKKALEERKKKILEARKKAKEEREAARNEEEPDEQDN
jgi:Skp family chaperone for outer membrane proteins